MDLSGADRSRRPGLRVEVGAFRTFTAAMSPLAGNNSISLTPAASRLSTCQLPQRRALEPPGTRIRTPLNPRPDARSPHSGGHLAGPEAVPPRILTSPPASSTGRRRGTHPGFPDDAPTGDISVCTHVKSGVRGDAAQQFPDRYCRTPERTDHRTRPRAEPGGRRLDDARVLAHEHIGCLGQANSPRRERSGQPRAPRAAEHSATAGASPVRGRLSTNTCEDTSSQDTFTDAHTPASPPV